MNMNKTFAAVLLVLAAQGFAATPGVDAPPEAAPPRPVVVPPITEHRLPNGVTVVVVPRHAVPLVSATLLVRAGPEADPQGRAGLAGLTATLLAKGATRQGRAVGATTLARQAEALGGTLDTGSDWRMSSAGMTVSTPKLEAALALIADVVRRPTLAVPELERARAQALDGLRVALSSPGSVASMALRRTFWGASVFGAVTTPASLQRIARADVAEFHRRWYRPDRAILVLAGDVTPEQGIALARRRLGDWKAPSGTEPPMPAQPAAPLDAALVVVDMPGAGQSGVAVAAPFIPLGSPERRVAQVASVVLGGGYSARLNQEVRIKRGLSYGATTDSEAHPSGGMIVAQTQTSHPNAAEVLKLMREEMLRLGRDAPTAEELAARQATLVGGFARRLETTGGLAAIVAGQLVAGRSLAELSRTVDEIMAVTPEQVREFAERRWKPEALRGVIAGDVKAAGESMKAVEAGALQVPLSGLDLERGDLRSSR